MKGAAKLKRMQHCSVGYNIALKVEDSLGGCNIAQEGSEAHKGAA
jgi:hypothetical protein